MKADHDTGYKQLFAHPELMRDLLRGFVPYAWAKDLEVAAFERVNASYVGDNGEHRHDDMVWRLRVGGECIYVYLLLEFQSSCDRWMALRMQVYIGLLYQDLLKQRKLKRSGKLPPVLPIVLYSGRRRWTASDSLSGLRLPQPEGLALFQPELKYLLIDQRKVGAGLDVAERNIVAALFSLERARSRRACAEVVNSVGEWLQAGSTQPLRRSILHWLSSCMQRKERGSDFSLEEEFSMGNLSLDEWMESVIEDRKAREKKREQEIQAKAEAEGLARGMARGQALGIAVGKAEGKVEGMSEGRAEGKAEGRELGRREVLRRTVERLLERQPYPVPPRVSLQIESADSRQLEEWLDRLLDGASAQELFSIK